MDREIKISLFKEAKRLVKEINRTHSFTYAEILTHMGKFYLEEKRKKKQISILLMQ